jgi:pyridoxine/pyridoxamine 5'-phosphate oxidase
MRVATFAELQPEFLARINQAVYCNMATADLQGRPRSRVIHPVWEGAIGWVISWPESPKAQHLLHNPHVSLAYFCHDSRRPVYIEAVAEWVTERSAQQRVWDYYKTVPPPMGFDPEPHYGTIDHPLFGLLRLTPWRIQLSTLGGESTVWQP